MSEGWPGPERRREVRFAVGGDVVCRFQIRARVRMVDISQSGALLETDTRLPVGSFAHLQATMTWANFAPEVQIRRVVEGGDPAHRFELGAVFVSMDQASRRSLDAFLGKASK